MNSDTDYGNRRSGSVGAGRPYSDHEQARVQPTDGALASRIATLQNIVGQVVGARQRLETLCDRLGVSYSTPPNIDPPETATRAPAVPPSLQERLEYQTGRLADELGRIERCNQALDAAL